MFAENLDRPNFRQKGFITLSTGLMELKDVNESDLNPGGEQEGIPAVSEVTPGATREAASEDGVDVGAEHRPNDEHDDQRRSAKHGCKLKLGSHTPKNF